VLLIIYAIYPAKPKATFSGDILYSDDSHFFANLSGHLPRRPTNGNADNHHQNQPREMPPGFHFVFNVDCRSGQYRTMAFTLIYSFLSMYLEDSGSTITELIRCDLPSPGLLFRLLFSLFYFHFFFNFFLLC
jgi:hypothetical protein